MPASIVRFSLVVLIGLFALSIAGKTHVYGAAPNVILVITDDQGYGDLSCYGNKILQTPHLDHLASESVRLENFQCNHKPIWT